MRDALLRRFAIGYDTTATPPPGWPASEGATFDFAEQADGAWKITVVSNVDGRVMAQARFSGGAMRELGEILCDEAQG